MDKKDINNTSNARLAAGSEGVQRIEDDIRAETGSMEGTKIERARRNPPVQKSKKGP